MTARPGNIELDLLRSFVCIAETGSFTQAAQHVGRTQSAISMQMSKLEHILDQKLLVRSRGSRIRLTEHGSSLFGRAKELLALHDSIWNSFHALGAAPQLSHADFALPMRAQREALTMQIMMTLLTNERFAEAYSLVMRYVERRQTVDAATLDTKSDELLMGLLSMLEFIAIHFLSNTIDREMLLRQRRSGLLRVHETLGDYIRYKRVAWARPNAYRSFEKMVRDHMLDGDPGAPHKLPPRSSVASVTPRMRPRDDLPDLEAAGPFSGPAVSRERNEAGAISREPPRKKPASRSPKLRRR